MIALARSVAAPLIYIACIFGITAETANAKIIHRWTFDKDGSDSVGASDAKLMDGAAVRDGKVVLDGQKNWVELPVGKTIEKLSSASFEAWFTWDEEQARWVRIFDFGHDRDRNMFFTVRSGRPEAGVILDTPRFAITTKGWQVEQKLCAPNPIDVEELTHVVITIDAEKEVGRLYINGGEAVKQTMTHKPSDLGETSGNWLGKSQYSGVAPYFDPFFKGSISEFRIYDHALSADDVEQNHKSGPDKLPAKSGASAVVEKPGAAEKPGNQSPEK